MLVAKLSVSYDRGTERNAPAHLGLERTPEETAGGGIVRGLGSHWRSPEAQVAAAECAREEQRARKAFAGAYLPGPFPGTYVITSREEPEALVRELALDPRVEARVSVYDLAPDGDLPTAEVEEWAARVQERIAGVSLGRGGSADAAGLDALERLAACPILAPETATRIREMVAGARLDDIPRAELRRSLAALPVQIAPQGAAPRRAPTLTLPLPAAEVAGTVPRRTLGGGGRRAPAAEGQGRARGRGQADRQGRGPRKP